MPPEREYPISVDRFLSMIRNELSNRNMREWTTPLTIYIDGKHYPVTGIRICDSRVEIEYDHSAGTIN